MKSHQTIHTLAAALVALLAGCAGGSAPSVVPVAGDARVNEAHVSAGSSITCTMENLVGPAGNNVWPYSTKVVGCTGTSATTLGNVQSAAQTIVDKYTTDGPKLQNLGPPIWIFHSAKDYATFFGPAANNPLPSGFGITYVANIKPGGPNHGKPYTLIFEQAGSVADGYPGHTAAHEMGHWIDRFIEGTVSNPFSSKTPWIKEVGADIAAFNALMSACRMPADVFDGLRGYPALPSTQLICANNGQGPGLAPPYTGTNQHVLQQAWPMIFAPGKNDSYFKEIFAEEVAVDGGVGWPDLDNYFERNDWWPCSQTLVKSQLTYGGFPGTPKSPYQWPAGCPVFSGP